MFSTGRVLIEEVAESPHSARTNAILSLGPSIEIWTTITGSLDRNINDLITGSLDRNFNGLIPSDAVATDDDDDMEEDDNGFDSISASSPKGGEVGNVRGFWRSYAPEPRQVLSLTVMVVRQ